MEYRLKLTEEEKKTAFEHSERMLVEVQLKSVDYKFSGIYQFVNKIDGKRYVGQSTYINKRVKNHKYASKKHFVNNYFYSAIQKHGWNNFILSILEKVDDFSKLNEREEFWITSLDTCNSKKGYNLYYNPVKTKYGIPVSESTRAKIRQSSLGKKMSLETRLKMSEAKKLKCWNPTHKIKIGWSVVQLDRKTKEVIKIWPSVKSVCETLKINKTAIYNAIHSNETRNSGGFKWKYLN